VLASNSFIRRVHPRGAGGDDVKIPDEIETLGDAIRWGREQRGVTLRALARKLDVSAPFLSDVEHGRRNPNINAIANALDLDVDDLLRRKLCMSAEEWRRRNPELAKLLDELSKTKRRCLCPWCRCCP
jgi:transcriptional regulator with XRE-family HTH domain